VWVMCVDFSLAIFSLPEMVNKVEFYLPDSLHGHGPFLLSYSVFDFIFSYFSFFWAVR